MNHEREPWFVPKPSGLGLTPVTWQGWCATLLFMFAIFATVGVIFRLVHDPATATISILLATAAELAVFIPFSYRHASSRSDF
jgi:hypothetical protein